MCLVNLFVDFEEHGGEGTRDPGTPEPKHRPLTDVPISDCSAVPGTTGITHVGRGVERNGDRVTRNELERGGMNKSKTRAYVSFRL